MYLGVNLTTFANPCSTSNAFYKKYNTWDRLGPFFWSGMGKISRSRQLINWKHPYHRLSMELFSRRRWRLVSAQLSNNFGYCPWCSVPFCIFINTTAYHLGRYEPSTPSTKELHGLRLIHTTCIRCVRLRQKVAVRKIRKISSPAGNTTVCRNHVRNMQLVWDTL